MYGSLLKTYFFKATVYFKLRCYWFWRSFYWMGTSHINIAPVKIITSLVGEYYFNVNNKGRRTPAKVGLVFLLLTLNRFYTLFCCLRSLLWASKCGLGTGFVDYFEQIFVFFLFLKCYILSSPYSKPSIDLQNMISIWQQHWTLIWFNYTVSNNQY